MKKILAVDGNSILNRAFYGIRPLTNKEGLHTNAVYGFVNILKKNLDELNPDGFAVAFDMRAPTFRHEKFEAYKAGRKGMPEELAMQLPYAKKCAEALGAAVIGIEGYEADDILGTIAEISKKNGDRAYILTGDRDSLQLIDDSTTVLLATNSETVYFDKEKFVEHYGITPDRFVDVKALMGDSSDNIPGVAGVGEKTALKLISEFGSLDGIYENFDSPTIKGSLRTKLENGKDSAYMSKWLATIIRDVPMGVGLSEIDGMTERAGASKAELCSLFEKLEFSAFIKRFGLDDVKDDAVNKDVPTCEICPCASPAEALAKALEFGHERVAVHFGESVSFSSDGVHAFSAEGEVGFDLLTSLKQNGVKIYVLDSKLLYTKYSVEDGFLFDFDVILAAYVVDPTDSHWDGEKLKLRYLGEASNTFTVADIFRIADKLMPIIEERGQEKLLFDIEMPLALLLSRMERTGFKVDVKGLTEFGKKLSEAAEALENRIFFLAGRQFNLKSPMQLSEVLFEEMGLPHGKKSKSGYYSTGVEILEKLAPYHEIVADILEYRQLTKLRSTYAEGLCKAADGEGRIHTSFNQTITATGRLSSTEPNLQNIPVRTELGREFRRFFIPDGEGRVLVDADYSQIELRILAHISEDEGMIEAFRSGIDIHTVTASQVFGVPIEAVTGEMRKRAKAVNFGIVYGIGDFSLSQDIGVTKKQAAEYMEAYKARYPKVKAYLEDIVKKGRADGFVTTMFGRRRDIPELSASKKPLQQFGERVAMNSPIQGSAADIIKIAMLAVDRALRESGLDAKLLLQVHDELIIESSLEDSEAVKELLVREMEGCVELLVPLTVSAAVGVSWFECKD